MKREAVDYFDGFAELFELAVRAEGQDAPELMRRSADKRGRLYKALVNEFLPPIERGDILDMINALHDLNLSAAELKLVCSGDPGTGKPISCGSDMLILTGKTVRELKNYKKPASLLEYANNIHREYCAAVSLLAGEKYAGHDRAGSFKERAIREKTEKLCGACERIACCAEQIVANNV